GMVLTVPVFQGTAHWFGSMEVSGCPARRGSARTSRVQGPSRHGDTRRRPHCDRLATAAADAWTPRTMSYRPRKRQTHRLGGGEIRTRRDLVSESEASFFVAWVPTSCAPVRLARSEEHTSELQS